MPAALRSFTVGTEAVRVAFVPAGRTVMMQNTGAGAATVSVGTPAVWGEGVVLAGGSPGGSLTTQPPGDTEAEEWWAVTESGTTTMAVVVI